MLGRRKKNSRKQTTESRWQLPDINWRTLGMSVGSVLAVCAVAAIATWTLDQPIQSVSVSGRFQRVAPVDVERVVKQQVRGAGLLSVNLDAVRHAIHSLPWVDAVSVQVAAARWGETGLLNTRGELFSKDERHMPPELAELSGPQGKESVVAQRYLAAQGRLIQAGLRLTAMRLDARGAWEFDLSNGVTVRLGRRQIDERFEKFINAALKLVTQRGGDISYVDMRYTNGFAIGWRGGATHSAKEDGGRDA